STYLSSIANENVTFKLTHIESENVLKGLNRYAEDQQADLMIMSTGQRAFFDQLFHRSLTQQMAFHTRIPLLIFHFND
ncbi:MAG: universal stress protein, partial [Bacteroidota bacterium]